MDVLITDPSSIRALSRIITCAAKIGEHLMLTTQPPSTLCLRVINPSHSTFAHFRLYPPFFASYALPPTPSAKLSTRSLLPLLRAPHTLATLRITSQPPTHVLFELKSRSALLKRFRVPIVEGRIGVSAFDKRAVSCLLQARPRLFLDVLANFHARLDEVTLAPCATSMRVASYVDDAANPANLMLRTEMTLAPREFDVYTCARPRAVPLTIFCKYWRAALEFCDPFDLPLRMWFEAAGQPVLFDLAHEGAMEATFDVQFIFASRHAESESVERPTAQMETPVGGGGRGVRRGRHTPLDGLTRRGEGTHMSGDPSHRMRDARFGGGGIGTDEVGGTEETEVPASLRKETPVGSFSRREERTPVQAPRDTWNRDNPLPPSKRVVRTLYDEDDGDEDGADERTEDEEDGDFVEGTPPPE